MHDVYRLPVCIAASFRTWTRSSRGPSTPSRRSSWSRSLCFGAPPCNDTRGPCDLRAVRSAVVRFPGLDSAVLVRWQKLAALYSSSSFGHARRTARSIIVTERSRTLTSTTARAPGLPVEASLTERRLRDCPVRHGALLGSAARGTSLASVQRCLSGGAPVGMVASPRTTTGSGVPAVASATLAVKAAGLASSSTAGTHLFRPSVWVSGFQCLGSSIVIVPQVGACFAGACQYEHVATMRLSGYIARRRNRLSTGAPNRTPCESSHPAGRPKTLCWFGP